MTVNRTTLLDLPLPVTGTESGTWGDTTNNGLTQYMDIAIAGMSNLTSANFTTGALTIETTEGNSSATNISATSAQYAGFRVTSLAQNSTITVGNTGTNPARSYRLINADATYTLTFKATGQTGVTLLPGQSAVVAFNGTDYVIVGMVGAGTATDNAVVRFDGTTGKLVQNSVVTIADSTGDVAGVGALTMGGNLTLNGGTANGVLYLNGSKVATSGSALTFDGTNLGVGNSAFAWNTAAFNNAIDLSVYGAIYSTSSVAGVTGNVYYDGSAWHIKTLGPSTRYDQTAGSHVFYAAPTPVGLGNTTPTFVEILRLNTTGITLDGGTANGVLYLNGSKVATSGSAVTYNGTTFATSADASVNGLTVGRGAGAVSTNTAVGASALAANTTGSNQVAVGVNALNANTTGIQNIAIGTDALLSNQTGNYNTAVGVGSLRLNTAANNTAFGWVALNVNTSGANNTALGFSALASNTTASNNTALGYQAAYSNTTGSGILAIGYQAGYSNTTGNGNTAIGNGNAFTGAALYSNVSGNNNVAVGSGSLNSTTASNNTAVGYEAARLTTSGGSNVAFGTQALYSNTTASNNTAVGYQAGYSNTTAADNTYIGRYAGYSGTTGYSNTFVGKNSGYGVTTGAGNTFVGSNANGVGAGQSVTTGSKNTILGGYDGNQGGLDIRTLSNYLVLSDGDGNPRIYHNGTTVVIPNLPTSSAGLPSGGLYVVAGALMVA